LKLGAALSLAGTAPVTAVVRGLSVSIDAHSPEMLYLGKPMTYWLSRLNCCDRDPEFVDGDNSWVLVNFGDGVVPHLIESLKEKEEWSLGGVTELQFMASPRNVRLLSLALGHSHPRVRAGVLDALMGIACHRDLRPQVIEPLRQILPAIGRLLTDNDPVVSYRARHFLDVFVPELDPSFIVPIDALDDPQATKRANAVRMLGKRPAEEAIPLLETKLGDSDSSVRWEAAEQLSKFDPDHPGIVPIFIDYLIRREHITAIGFSGLDRIVVKALPTLLKALKSEGPKVRVSILHGVRWGESDAVLPTLLEMLNDPFAEVRSEAICGLAWMKTDTILPHLIRALEDEADSVRRQVRWVFERRRPDLARQAVPELMKILESGKPSGRVSAALILAELGHEGMQALPLLRKELQSLEPEVRLAAAIAIARIQPESLGLGPILFAGLSHSNQEISEKAVRALGKMGMELKSMIPQLIEGLKHESTQEISVKSLGKIGAEATQAVPCLVDLLQNRSRSLGCCVPVALAGVGSKALPPLTKLIEHEETFVRARAIKTIGLIGALAVNMVPRLVEKLNTGTVLERVAAAEALGNIGPAGANLAVPALRAVVKVRDLAIRREAIDALGKMKEKAESAIPELCSILDEAVATQIKWRLLLALKNIGVAAVPTLLQSLRNADEWVRTLAARELSECGKLVPAVIPALVKCLEDADPGVRAEAVESLGKLGSRAVGARSCLEQLLRDPCEIVQARTKLALTAILT
jgi:HEAT repeat protein